MKNIEKELLICEKTRDEGIGSIYERVILQRFFSNLEKQLNISKVLEYHAYITKGYDNTAFSDKVSLTIADANPQILKSQWDFKQKARFIDIGDINETYDLVWNFAVYQHKEEVLEKMKEYANKYILIFTPNIFNLGTIPHVLFHKLVRTECNHPESGNRFIRTEYGLRKMFESNNIQVIKSGGVDVPWWPDTAYSFAEVKKELGIKPTEKETSKEEKEEKTPEEIHNLVEKSTFIEFSNLPKFMKIPFIHHNYCLGKIS